MKKLLLIALSALLPSLGMAAGGSGPTYKANIDLTDQESLQRGAKMFVQYCNSCHGAQYLRFNRMATDLGILNDKGEIDVEALKADYMFTTDKVGEQMKIAMSAADAQIWFGTKVPDLSLVARSRGTDWLYTYLLTFYQDDSRPMGVNNLKFPDVGMPHVLSGLQGVQKPVYKTVKGDDGSEHQVIESLEIVKAGSMTGDEYEAAVLDLVNFLTYAAEPGRVDRERLGFWVILFLVIFTVMAYMLKKEYWKDVH